MAKAEHNTIFDRELTKLNHAQRQAVETIEGPVMVVAGPGTGKTQVVAMRIAQILRQTQLNARNVLALTFTEAGVTALQKRLESIVGADAYQVTVSTFHGFANEVVATFPYVFGFAVEAMQVSELERLQIIHQIVERSTKLTTLRPVRSPTFHVRSIAEAIRQCKQENVSPEKLRLLVKEESTPRVTRSMGKLEAENLHRKHQLQHELADVYAEYQTTLTERNLYDYEDMILFAVDGLKNDPDVRAYYQERYQYLLVDEYQDTNNAQNALVEALAEFYPNPNLCVVGDDKQAIYRFQGASVANMLHFARKYPTLKIIALAENYRSAPPVIDAASALITHNRHQLSNYLPKLQEELIATRAADRCELKLVSFPTIEAQFGWITERIHEQQKKGISLNNMAVLFRRNDEVRSFRDFALKADLPVAGVEATNLITEPEIQQLLLLLQAVLDPSEGRLLAPALRLITPLSAITVARLARELTEKPGLTHALKALAIESTEIKQIETAMATLERWSTQVRSVPLGELVEQILCESRIMKELADLPNSLEHLELLKAFVNEVQRFAIQHPGQTLTNFLGYINLLRQYQVRLPVHRLTPTVEGVFVATVHGAKGLEFETVFLPNVTNKVWQGRAKRELIKLPKVITGLKTWDEDPVEDERRLFYVALTRAKNCVYATYSRFSAEGTELLPSQFISEIEDHFPHEDYQLTPPQAQAVLVRALSPISAIRLRGQEKNLVRELVTTRPFSYTDYKTYRLCPQQYLLNCVLRFPTKPEPRLVYGALLHRALELFYKQYRSRQKLPSAEALTRFLDQAARQSEPFRGKTVIVERAKMLLEAYHRHLGADVPIPAGVEYSFTAHHVMLDSIWITGKFDRIDPIDPLARTVRIVDYKTGSQAQTRNQIEGKTKTSEGELREQLVFYSLLATHDRHFPYHATEFALKFLDDKHTFREETFRVQADEATALANDVTAAYQEILSLDEFVHGRDQFDRGCELCEIFATLA